MTYYDSNNRNLISAFEKYQKFDMGLSSLTEAEDFANQLTELDTQDTKFFPPEVEIHPFGKGCVWEYETGRAVYVERDDKIYLNSAFVLDFLKGKNRAAELVQLVGHELTHAKQREYVRGLSKGTIKGSEIRGAYELRDSLLCVSRATVQSFKNAIKNARRQSKEFDKYASQFDNLSEREKELKIFRVYRSYNLQTCAEEDAREKSIAFTDKFFQSVSQVVSPKELPSLQKSFSDKIAHMQQVEKKEKEEYHYYQDFVKKLEEYGFKFNFEVVCIDNVTMGQSFLTTESKTEISMIIKRR